MQPPEGALRRRGVLLLRIFAAQHLTMCIDMSIQCIMSPKQMTAFRLEPDIIDGLNRVKDRDGIPFSVQVDRALRAWLDKKGVTLKTPRAGKRRATGGSR